MWIAWLRPGRAHKYRQVVSWTKSRPIATVLSRSPISFYFSHCALCNRCACTLHTNASTLEAHERDTGIFARICGLVACVRAPPRGHSDWYGVERRGMAWYGVVWRGMARYGAVWRGMACRANSSPSINLHLAATVGASCWIFDESEFRGGARSFAPTFAPSFASCSLLET